MSRQSNDEFRNGELWNGHDYALQAWIRDGRIVGCGHGANMGNGICCNGRRYAGVLLEDARKLEVMREMGAFKDESGSDWHLVVGR